MRLDQRDAAHLWDMLEAAREARAYLGETGNEALLANRMRLRALERVLEILGEAARRVSAQTQENLRGIDWRGLVGLRNVLAHEYGSVDHVLLIATAKRSLPPLISSLEKIVA
jgi:uncharacterized protein with HEPN domain